MPALSATTRYGPGITEGNTYNPTALLADLSSIPVAVLVKTTVTFGMTAPVESWTTPRTLPLLDWARAGMASKAIRIDAMTPIENIEAKIFEVFTARYSFTGANRMQSSRHDLGVQGLAPKN
jgi:hypothetical protein